MSDSSSESSGNGGGFLGRWSQRKRAVAEEARQTARGGATPVMPEPVEEEASLPELYEGDERALTEEEEAVVASLPDIESLDAESDFTPFMQSNVPEFLRRRALRALWRLNPVLANVDGLVDYGEDFTDSAMVVEGLQTAYRVGKGFLTDEEHEELLKTGREETEPVSGDKAEDETGADTDGEPESSADGAMRDDATSDEAAAEIRIAEAGSNAEEEMRRRRDTYPREDSEHDVGEGDLE